MLKNNSSKDRELFLEHWKSDESWDAIETIKINFKRPIVYEFAGQCEQNESRYWEQIQDLKMI